VDSGQAAVDFMREHSMDLIVLDMVMDPGMSGLETYRHIVEIHPGQKAIIVSGYTESDEVMAAFEKGVAHYVKKPYAAETIAKAVKEVLAH
jgi:DNA-binding NarL/FixJ family response regulator